jgi:nicotinate-nucleotide pyrophosphorylase (carboxylating)
MADQLQFLLPPNLKDIIISWLKEDIPSFDGGAFVVGSKEETAVLLCKQEGVMCGKPFVDAIFDYLACKVEWYVDEGEELKPIREVAKFTGPVCRLLQGERTALNIVTRASGIATHARELVQAVSEEGWEGEVAGTRKTTPGFRIVEKYALLVGGASTHRYDLSSMIMLKDNHIWSVGGVKQAVEKARKVAGFSMKIEVECRSLEEVYEAATAGADVVMLDNFSVDALIRAVPIIKEKHPHLILEASGGVRLSTIKSYCIKGLDVVSLSTTTQGYSAVDFSFKVQKKGRDPTNPTVDHIQ